MFFIHNNDYYYFGGNLPKVCVLQLFKFFPAAFSPHFYTMYFLYCFATANSRNAKTHWITVTSCNEWFKFRIECRRKQNAAVTAFEIYELYQSQFQWEFSKGETILNGFLFKKNDITFHQRGFFQVISCVWFVCDW